MTLEVEDHYGGPEHGHQFHISVRIQGSSAVVGEPLRDEEQASDPLTMTVRSWNLRDALEIAAKAPLEAWDYGEEE